MKVLICGGRAFDDGPFVDSHLNKLAADWPSDTIIIEGGALGADRLARLWAEENNYVVQTFPAQWKQYGDAAGMIRNQLMITKGQPDLVVAFPGGRGTADMIARAIAQGIRVKIIAR